MTLADLFADFLANGTGRSLVLLAPELIVCVTIVALLLGRLTGWERVVSTSVVAAAGILVAFGWSAWQLQQALVLDQPTQVLFTGMVRLDRFALFLRAYLLLFLVLQVVLASMSGIPDREDSPDFHTLLLGATVGLLLMTTAQHLLLVFLALEMSSVPGYVLAGFLKGRRQSSEAALKFVIFGSASAGLLLFGLTILCGLAGTGDMSLLGGRLNAVVAIDGATLANPVLRTLLLALVMVFAGLAFKLSLVPFHFWCPDVFHGAAAEVGVFLSVASKAATVGLFTRLLLALVEPGNVPEVGVGVASVLDGFWRSVAGGLGVVSAVTVTFGNLAAFGQTNIKRLMAYSTISHAGYLLMPLAVLAMPLAAGPLTAFPDVDGAGAGAAALANHVRAVEGMLYYLVVTLFMNLGVFTCIIIVRNQTFGESLEDFRGLAASAPVVAVAMAVSLASLIGLPPLGGFVAKLMVFASLYEAGTQLPLFYGVLVIGAFNTLLSLLVYLKLLKAMFLESRSEAVPVVRTPLFSMMSLYLLAITAPVLSLGIDVSGLSRLARLAALSLWEGGPAP